MTYYSIVIIIDSISGDIALLWLDFIENSKPIKQWVYYLRKSESSKQAWASEDINFSWTANCGIIILGKLLPPSNVFKNDHSNNNKIFVEFEYISWDRLLVFWRGPYNAF
ncbi:hypothetical protein PHYBLDRAFT_165059 [Phycomyces blakesleeanus NRRL 1555(-)]|uniref:Uncharacterized protein n=1 Tax=Phycomyces blakesleeanus (strain ATCC 8743b / DSM 1359 / FGSC 10004 / NBRC 33097 / NRRL 1555) TaxID=763407 RepID=A0A163AY09_PHYB8|nr:hypothetical protein PHYBLDRAFT_165059 [Phycomyces blakesleeanus NRRL 1555(-)]OAD76531.1 hypothetical protein PHYBLDRAFT_165059 [Phycomyces blakesleeanus NRRL 1555(-)]|eukprot:XP_018294571.1 hypothetical protein PHYBLDRAFT_165059 [Phycomyces blakesleeanus NRRL 1555(-)]